MSFRRLWCEFIISYDPDGDDNFGLYDQCQLSKYDLAQKHQRLVFRNNGTNQIEKYHNANVRILYNLLSLDEIDKIYICKDCDMITLHNKSDIEKINNTNYTNTYIGMM